MIRHLQWITALAASTAVAFSLAACSGSESSQSSPVASATTESPEDTVADVQKAYWDTYVQLANSGDVAPQAFKGIAEGSFVERDLKVLGDQADTGFVRVGGPSYSDFVATVKGTSATSLVCVDFTSWGGKNAQGEAVEIPKTPPSPFLATLENQDGTWIMTDQEYQKATPCP